MKLAGAEVHLVSDGLGMVAVIVTSYIFFIYLLPPIIPF